MKPGASQAQRERSVLKTLLIAFALLAIGFSATWAYQKYAERQRLSSSYTSIKPVAISRSGYSIAATFVVKTSNADARWAMQNRSGIEAALHQALLGIDPARALAPGGLRELQQDMQARLNRMLGTNKVQEVVITDFLVSEGDY